MQAQALMVVITHTLLTMIHQAVVVIAHHQVVVVIKLSILKKDREVCFLVAK